MKRYIDAEKLIAEIERRKVEWKALFDGGENRTAKECFYEDENILDIITSLQQEQHTCKTCGFYENNCPFIRGKLISYPNKVCKDYTYSATKEQEQQEMDLVKYISNRLCELGADLINHELSSFDRGLNVGKTNSYYDILGFLNIRKEENRL